MLFEIVFVPQSLLIGAVSVASPEDTLVTVTEVSEGDRLTTPLGEADQETIFPLIAVRML
jgi:hypothetical protein